MGFTNVRIARDSIKKYGPTKGCLGCKHVLKENYYKGHDDNCRKRFLELSNEPGNEDLKARLDQSFERATRKYLETEEQEERRSDKRVKTQDTRNPSKQNAKSSSSSSSQNIRRDAKRDEREEDEPEVG